MQLEEPTKAQSKEFWERCGFKDIGSRDKFKRLGGIEYPDGCIYSGYPPINLNSIFEYAVPKAIDKIMAEQECSSDLAYAILFKKWLQKLECDIPNHAGTLYWAIWEVIDNA